MKRGAITLLLALLAIGSPRPAHAVGAWQTYLRPTSFAAVLAEGDTVWCASRDAGLLQFTPSTRTFNSILRVPNGLASNSLTAMAFDHSRRMWLGTNGAGVSVNLPDRARWRLVNHIDGLPSDIINTLTVQGDSIWIGTAGGLALWDGDEVAGRLPDGINPSPFANDNITGIEIRGDTVWVATSGGVYTALKSQRLLTWSTANTGLLSVGVTRLIGDGTTLFAVANRAMHRWDSGTSRWIVLSGLGNVLTASKPHNLLYSGTSKGIYRWTGTVWTVVDTTLKSSDDSPLMVGLDDQGLVRAAGRPLSARDASGTGLYSQPASGTVWTFDWPSGPPGNNDVNLDFDGDRLYLETYGNGIGRLQGGQWRNWFAGPTNVQSDTTFRRPVFPLSMLVDKQSLKWFANWAPLINPGAVCVPDTGAYEVLDDLGSVNHVTHRLYGPAPDSAKLSYAWGASLDSGMVDKMTLVRSPAGGRWFGLASPCSDQPNLTPAGLLYFSDGNSAGQNFNNSNSTLPNGLVWSLAADRNKRLWVGTNLGLCYFDTLLAGAPLIHRLHDTETFSVRALATRSDTLWVFIPGKLYQFGITGTNRGYYDVLSSVSSLGMHPMDIGRDGTLWLGTSDGVTAYHPGQPTPETFNTSNSPLADNDVRTVRVDRRTGYVWFATGAGLSRYDPGYVLPTSQLPSLTIQAFPNPTRLSSLGVTLRLSGNGATYTGAIYDLTGRRVAGFSVLGNDRIVWDGRDTHGDVVKPGIYFLRAESGGRSAVARLVVLR